MARVLLIEDDEDLLATLTQQLENAGHSVLPAPGGTVALTIAKSSPVDVVVTDVIMRTGEGIETLRTLKGLYPDMPVIAMSGNPAYLESMKSLGAAAILRKPFRFERLLAEIESATNC